MRLLDLAGSGLEEYMGVFSLIVSRGEEGVGAVETNGLMLRIGMVDAQVRTPAIRDYD